MKNYDVYLPSYSIGDDVYRKIPSICLPFGKKAVVIGGKQAMAASLDEILKYAKEQIEILDIRWYGGEASYENVAVLEALESVRNADMIFAVGGGKALDTCKTLGENLNKPVFAFPTIASTCAATTAVSIMYHPDGSFLKPHFLKAPPKHAFIHTGILAKAPSRYLWAGMGDTYAKYFESTMSSRGEELTHYHALGVTTSHMCLSPILSHGKAALDANREGNVTDAFEEVVLAIIVTTGIASILLTKEKKIDYNTGLAHAIFYSLTSDKNIEENHLHGEVVGFGVLVLLLVDGDVDMFRTMFDFHQSVGLPTCLGDIEYDASRIEEVAKAAAVMHDIDHNPYPITAEMIQCALEKLENYHNRKEF